MSFRARIVLDGKRRQIDGSNPVSDSAKRLKKLVRARGFSGRTVRSVLFALARGGNFELCTILGHGSSFDFNSLFGKGLHDLIVVERLALVLV